MKFLLDTTVISDFTRGVPAVMERLKMTTKTDVWISTVAVMQIEYGSEAKSHAGTSNRTYDSRAARRFA